MADELGIGAVAVDVSHAAGDAHRVDALVRILPAIAQAGDHPWIGLIGAVGGRLRIQRMGAMRLGHDANDAKFVSRLRVPPQLVVARVAGGGVGDEEADRPQRPEPARTALGVVAGNQLPRQPVLRRLGHPAAIVGGDRVAHQAPSTAAMVAKQYSQNTAWPLSTRWAPVLTSTPILALASSRRHSLKPGALCRVETPE